MADVLEIELTAPVDRCFLCAVEVAINEPELPPVPGDRFFWCVEAAEVDETETE